MATKLRAVSCKSKAKSNPTKKSVKSNPTKRVAKKRVVKKRVVKKRVVKKRVVKRAAPKKAVKRAAPKKAVKRAVTKTEVDKLAREYKNEYKKLGNMSIALNKLDVGSAKYDALYVKQATLARSVDKKAAVLEKLLTSLAFPGISSGITFPPGRRRLPLRLAVETKADVAHSLAVMKAAPKKRVVKKVKRAAPKKAVKRAAPKKRVVRKKYYVVWNKLRKIGSSVRPDPKIKVGDYLAKIEERTGLIVSSPTKTQTAGRKNLQVFDTKREADSFARRLTSPSLKKTAPKRVAKKRVVRKSPPKSATSGPRRVAKKNPSDLPKTSRKYRAKKAVKRAAGEAWEGTKSAAKKGGAAAWKGTKSVARKGGRKAAELSKDAAVWTGKKVAKGGKRVGRKAGGTIKETAKGAWAGMKKGWKENPAIPKKILDKARRLEAKAFEMWEEAGKWEVKFGKPTKESRHYEREAGRLYDEAAKLTDPYCDYGVRANPAGKTFLAWTNAPKAYDYWYVKDTGVKHGDFRLVEVSDKKRWDTFQMGRYQSGFKVGFPASDKKQVKLFGLPAKTPTVPKIKVPPLNKWKLVSEGNYRRGTTYRWKNFMVIESAHPRGSGLYAKALYKQGGSEGIDERILVSLNWKDIVEAIQEHGPVSNPVKCNPSKTNNKTRTLALRNAYSMYSDGWHYAGAEGDTERAADYFGSGLDALVEGFGAEVGNRLHVVEMGSGEVQFATEAQWIAFMTEKAMGVPKGRANQYAQWAGPRSNVHGRLAMYEKSPAYTEYYERARGNPTPLAQRKRRMTHKGVKLGVETGSVYFGEDVKGRPLSVGPYRTATAKRQQYALFVGNMPVQVMRAGDAVSQFMAMAKPTSIRSTKRWSDVRSNPAKKTGGYKFHFSAEGHDQTVNLKSKEQSQASKEAIQFLSENWGHPVHSVILESPSGYQWDITDWVTSKLKGSSRKAMELDYSSLDLSDPQSRMAFTTRPKGNPTGKFQATAITLTRTEGGNHDLNEPHEVVGGDVWNKANVLLSLWGREAKEGENNKVKFHIRYSNRETYSGTYYVSRTDQVTGNLGKHMQSVLQAGAGKKRPTHMTAAQYKTQLAKVKPAAKKRYADFLKKYEIGSPTCKPCQAGRKSNPCGTKMNPASSKPKIHKFASSGDAYDECQWNEDIKSGDVLVIEKEKIVGVAWAWPVAVTMKYGSLHTAVSSCWTMKRQNGVEVVDKKLYNGQVAAIKEADRRGWPVFEYLRNKCTPAEDAAGKRRADELKANKPKEITLRYRTVDGLDEVKTFKSIAAARKFAHQKMGDSPEISLGFYAIGRDGVSKISATGADIKDIFPRSNPTRPARLLACKPCRARR